MIKVLLVVALFALVTYGLIRIIERRGLSSPKRGRGSSGGSRPKPRPVAPDDDPDFLRDLDRKRRRPKNPEEPTG